MNKELPDWIKKGPGSKEWKRQVAKSRMLIRRVALPFSPGPGKSRRVYQDEFGVCAQPSWIFTTGLGPCIGLCIAWRCWAGIAHSSDIDMDHCDLMRSVILRAKKAIPTKKLQSVHPVICGGDIATVEDDPHPEDFVKSVLQSRTRIVELLQEAGFGVPRVRWNELNEATKLIANLNKGEVYIDNGYEIVGCWPISS